MKTYHYLWLIIVLLFSCSKEVIAPEDAGFFKDDKRNFSMGFTSWPYAPTLDAVNDTYLFLDRSGDVYEEIFPQKVPWKAFINDETLPTAYVDDVYKCVYHRISGKKMILSVSPLSIFRDNLAPDYDGSLPVYTRFSDATIEDAYFKHLSYLIENIRPDYLIFAMEVNEIYVHNFMQWQAFKILMKDIEERLRSDFPELPISVSITLHSLYEPDITNAGLYQQEVFDFVNQADIDFVSVSFYPFFKKLKTKDKWQQAFDLLYERINKKLAFSETGHISADLEVAAYNFSVTGSQEEQNEFLKTLLLNAQDHAYEFVIWWTHRDYYQTWLTFPSETQDLGKFWLTTGLLNDDGGYKEAYFSWMEVYDKPILIN